ncbi:MAG: hypothetical protein KKH02_10320 [Proteobacteria bacterium]|nr:hypothetical protein [Pseudomonadota bacterium]
MSIVKVFSIIGKTHLSARRAEGRSVCRKRLKKPDELFRHINKSFAACQEDIGYRISRHFNMAFENLSSILVAGSGVYFVFSRGFGYNAEQWVAHPENTEEK